jgi:TIR domain
MAHDADKWEVQAIEGTSDNFGEALRSAILQVIRQQGTKPRYRPSIFVSYAREDYSPIVYKLIYDLRRAAWGFGRGGKPTHMWVDREFLGPGVTWASEISDAIDNANTFLFAVTPALRDNSYCYQELAHAVTKNKRILVLLLRGCSMTPLLQDKLFPSGMSRRQFQWFRDDMTYDIVLDSLTNPQVMLLKPASNDSVHTVDLVWELLDDRRFGFDYLNRSGPWELEYLKESRELSYLRFVNRHRLLFTPILYIARACKYGAIGSFGLGLFGVMPDTTRPLSGVLFLLFYLLYRLLGLRWRY